MAETLLRCGPGHHTYKLLEVRPTAQTGVDVGALVDICSAHPELIELLHVQGARCGEFVSYSVPRYLSFTKQLTGSQFTRILSIAAYNLHHVLPYGYTYVYKHLMIRPQASGYPICKCKLCRLSSVVVFIHFFLRLVSLQLVADPVFRIALGSLSSMLNSPANAEIQK